ncbi:hypothetical protein ACLKA6_000221 [Drosophila palustris]
MPAPNVQVDGKMLPLPLPYFMSPVCGAACVIDMLTVNVIGGTTDTKGMWSAESGDDTVVHAVLSFSAFDGCAEVVKPSHRHRPLLSFSFSF